MCQQKPIHYLKQIDDLKRIDKPRFVFSVINQIYERQGVEVLQIFQGVVWHKKQKPSCFQHNDSQKNKLSFDNDIE